MGGLLSTARFNSIRHCFIIAFQNRVGVELVIFSGGDDTCFAIPTLACATKYPFY